MQRISSGFAALTAALLGAATHSQANLRAASAPFNPDEFIFAFTSSRNNGKTERLHKQLASCKYTGADLRRSRSERGVGRPPAAA